MLGLRGCRLAIKFPEIADMQVRAIIDAAIAVKQKGKEVLPELRALASSAAWATGRWSA